MAQPTKRPIYPLVFDSRISHTFQTATFYHHALMSLSKEAHGSLSTPTAVILIYAARPQPPHFSFQQALDACRQALAPGGTGYFTGVTHEFEHSKIDEWIAGNMDSAEQFTAICSYDGLVIPLGDSMAKCT